MPNPKRILCSFVIFSISFCSLGIAAKSVDATNTDLTPVINATQSTSNDGIVTSKTAIDNGDGTYDLQLESYVTSSVTTSTENAPTDYVLVLDQSGSMSDDFGEAVYEIIVNQGTTYQNAYNAVSRQEYYVKINDDMRLATISYSRFNNRYSLSYSNGYRNITLETSKGANDVIGYDLYTRKSKSRLDGLSESVTSFVSSIRQKSTTKYSVNDRIAMVGFSSGNYDNTEILTGCTVTSSQNDNYFPNNINYVGVQKDSNDYSNACLTALQDVTTNNGYKNVQDAVGYLTAYGATRTDYGMEMAEDIINRRQVTTYDLDGVTRNRNVVVVLFTDGTPTTYSDFSTDVANGAISSSYNLKNNNAKVFTVGVFDDASNAAIVGNTSNTNKFMHYVSNNYPTATSMNVPGNRVVDPNIASYYMTADDQEKLNSAFETISNSSAQADVQLDSKAILQDVVTDEFDIVGDEVSVSVYPYAGKQGDEYTFGSTSNQELTNNINVTINGKTVQVSGFDYSSNMCVDPSGSIPMSGYKISVTVKIRPNGSSLGGNDIVTNDIASGIYEGTNNHEIVETFNQPSVNLPINNKLVTGNQDIYISNSANMETLLQDTVVLDGTNNKYVNTVYSIKDSLGNVIKTITVSNNESKSLQEIRNDLLVNLTVNDDTKYLFTVSLVPISDGANSLGEPVVTNTLNQEANIYVYKPVVTLQNKTIFLGEEVSEFNPVSNIIFKHNETISDETTMGQAPTLSFEYDNNYIGTFEEDSNFNVSKVTINDQDITNYTTLNSVGDNESDFSIFVVKGQFTITKNIDSKYSDINAINSYQTFIYKIEQLDDNQNIIKTFYQTISFGKDDSNSKQVVVSNLSKGIYRVSEETSWSKKYDLIKTKDNYENDDGVINIGYSLNNKNYYGYDKECLNYKADVSHDENLQANITYTNNIKLWKGWHSDSAGATNNYDK